MKALLLTSTLVITYLYTVTALSQCSTLDGSSGKCLSIYNCSSLLKYVTDPTPESSTILKSSFCKFVGTTPWVCCPSDACTTPDGVQGTCIGLYSCPHIMDMLQSSPSQATIEYIRRSRCGNPQQKQICCGPLSTSSFIPAAEIRSVDTCRLTAYPPDPTTECCGIDASGGGNRIIGGIATSIDEYPWMALIEYVKGVKTKLMCGGVLISGKYVLTASHCVVGPVLNAGTPTNVRLGEYDTSNEGADCVEVEGGGEDCNDGALSISIEKIIPHPDYDPTSTLRRHDIALIRLKWIVQYTDFIRPICLPTNDFTTAPPADASLYAAGWGAVSDIQSSSTIKLKVRLPYVTYKDCQPSYNVPIRKVPLWEGQICAGGVNGKDSCKGDSGGPLMRDTGGLFELVGIVSFGPTPCGMENVAGVYSKVFHYLPWIRSHLVA